MNNLRSDNCSDSSFHSHCAPPLPPRNSQLQKPSFRHLLPRGPVKLLTHVLHISPFSQQYLQRVLVFSQLFLLMETRYNIPTSGKPADSLASFHPISLNSCISNLFERLTLNRLCFYLECKNLMSLTQAGFRPGRSMIDQVLQFCPPLTSLKLSI